MSDQIKKVNVFDLFGSVQETYQEASEKARKEQGGNKIENFRMGEDGKYLIRILPLAPVIDKETGEILPMDRKGYEYPLKQMFLDINVTGKDGKERTINIPVINSTRKGVGFSVDLVDTYVKIAKEIHGDDKVLMELIGKNSFGHGLKWNNVRCMYVLDLNHRDKGPLLWKASYSQYKDLDDARRDLWGELKEDSDEELGCPISAFRGAYPVVAQRKTEKNKTEYKFTIRTVKSDTTPYDLTESELSALLDMPRIPDIIYRYTRYQAEATYEFLKQYDKRHGMSVTSEPDFEDAYKKLLGELPKDDDSHFDLKSAGDESAKSDKVEELTLDDMWDKYNDIADKDLPSDAEEYQNFRELLSKFIADNHYDVRISHSKTNKQILEEIEDIIDEEESVPDNAVRPQNEQPSKPAEEPDDEKEEDDELPFDEPDEEPDEKPVRRQRRARPSDEDDDDESKVEPVKAVEEETNEQPTEGGRRRRRHNK